ncbi:MAG: hypothetical protein JWM28_3971, partial [Chitinophagaceae bacterium]|nr:hypothetical protein [Chitinophagaceae bacterium]
PGLVKKKKTTSASFGETPKTPAKQRSTDQPFKKLRTDKPQPFDKSKFKEKAKEKEIPQSTGRTSKPAKGRVRSSSPARQTGKTVQQPKKAVVKKTPPVKYKKR